MQIFKYHIKNLFPKTYRNEIYFQLTNDYFVSRTITQLLNILKRYITFEEKNIAFYCAFVWVMIIWRLENKIKTIHAKPLFHNINICFLTIFIIYFIVDNAVKYCSLMNAELKTLFASLSETLYCRDQSEWPCIKPHSFSLW